MAAVCLAAANTIEKNSEILVKVEESLVDLLVVSYSTDDQKFHGVLLDSNKGNLPYGIYNLHPAFTKSINNSEKDNKLHSVSQRFSYLDPGQKDVDPSPKQMGLKNKAQKQKMTVRLRPRKVLCSNCKGICNENSENVDVKKRKLELSDESSESLSHDAEKKFLMGSQLIPRLSRLHPTEISNAIKGTKVKADCIETCSEAITEQVTFVNVSEDENTNKDKHATAKHSNNRFNSIFSNAKTIKFCFGEGERTVIKIPSIPSSGDIGAEQSKIKVTDSKAAKKALKRAKKNAKKCIGANTAFSPKHNGALSPRNNVADNKESERKHKHKTKHKKKHKADKDRDENEAKCLDDSIIGEIQNYCLNRRMSIRSLSSNSNESCSEEWDCDTVPEFPSSGLAGESGKHVRVTPGDIVWGKVTGFPWWPGRVTTVSTSSAHVDWYASTTSSLMPCDSLSPFLEDFKLRFNKKKRGAYREAVKLATVDAKLLETQPEDPLAGPTHITSPRPINVI